MIRAGQGVALLTIALLVVGVLMVNSTGLVVESTAPPIDHATVFLGAPAIHAMLAVAALAAGPTSRSAAG